MALLRGLETGRAQCLHNDTAHGEIPRMSSVSLADLHTADLLVDGAYDGGWRGNVGEDSFPRLLAMSKQGVRDPRHAAPMVVAAHNRPQPCSWAASRGRAHPRITSTSRLASIRLRLTHPDSLAGTSDDAHGIATRWAADDRGRPDLRLIRHLRVKPLVFCSDCSEGFSVPFPRHVGSGHSLLAVLRTR